MNGIQRIKDERQRQISTEGWTPEHDAIEHGDGTLGIAAKCYLDTAKVQIASKLTKLPPCFVHKNWPWDREWWKPSNDPARNLEKAGALYLAEAERLELLEQINNAKITALYAGYCGELIDSLGKEGA